MKAQQSKYGDDVCKSPDVFAKEKDEGIGRSARSDFNSVRTKIWRQIDIFRQSQFHISQMDILNYIDDVNELRVDRENGRKLELAGKLMSSDVFSFQAVHNYSSYAKLSLNFFKTMSMREIKAGKTKIKKPQGFNKTAKFGES